MAAFVPVRPRPAADAAAITASLEQLTSGWSAASGVAPELLTAARQALAQTLLSGRTISEIRPARKTLQAGPPADPQLSARLRVIVDAAIAAPEPRTIAIVRSALTATPSNPGGRPEWARSAHVVQSYGPFADLQGMAHYVEILLGTVSLPFAFGDPTAKFAVFPVFLFLPSPPAPSQLALGPGSVWFLAKMLGQAMPDATFTGFAITGGTLTCSSPFDFQGDAYVIPPAATVTIEVTLAPAATPPATGAGQDAAAAVFTPPAHVQIRFQQGAASFVSIADCSARAYESEIKLHWNQSAPTPAPGLPLALVWCDSSPAQMAFATVHSQIFRPSGTAPVAAAAWALPVAAVALPDLPELANAGAAAILYGAGSSIQTAVNTLPAPVASGVLEIGTGLLNAWAAGKAKPARTTYQLWPEAAPSKRHATAEFTTPEAFLFGYASVPGSETLGSAGALAAHMDMPLSAAGARFPYWGGAVLVLEQVDSTTMLGIVADQVYPAQAPIPVALENALLGVDPPALLSLTGMMQGLTAVKGWVGLSFQLRWLLPTLPDPYAATFDTKTAPHEGDPNTIVSLVTWTSAEKPPKLSFQLLPATKGTNLSATPFAAETREMAETFTALLDLSTRVDLFGVALAPQIGRLATGGHEAVPSAPVEATGAGLALSGMQLALNGSVVATFALPQVSWEPIESVVPDQTQPIECNPASDGSPLLIAAPNAQQLVPFNPDAVLNSNIANVAAGFPFAAVFSLPFGLYARIIEPNGLVQGKISDFLLKRGEFRLNQPQFPASFVPNPSQAAGKLYGAKQLTLRPMWPEVQSAFFHGSTQLDKSHTVLMGGEKYGVAVLGGTDPGTSSVPDLFESEFSNGGGVPVRRIDFSGYGASIYSEWFKAGTIVGIIKVQFQTPVGRTAFELIQAVSVIFPYCVRAVRTVTMERQNAGWVKRTDSLWQPVSHGVFDFPGTSKAKWVDRVHPGPFAGAFDVRHIREEKDSIEFDSGGVHFKFKKVLFDADLGIDRNLRVVDGGFVAAVAGVMNPPMLTASRDIVGWLQVEPLVLPDKPEAMAHCPDPDEMQILFDRAEEFTPKVACSVEAGASNGFPGTRLRCSMFELGMIPAANGGPALGVALRGAPQIPSGGGWSLARRKYTEPAPSALPQDYPAPLVQPAGSGAYWYIADVTDIVNMKNQAQPDAFYSLMHSTGTQKVLFEAPQIPTAGSKPGLQFATPTGPPRPGSAPPNPGSPNLGDIASILNATGLFPDLSQAVSMLKAGIQEQIETIAQGFQYKKSYTFPADQKSTLIDVPDLCTIDLRYADTTKSPPDPTQLTYLVDSSKQPSWGLTVGPMSFCVAIPFLGDSPVLTITGGFAADEHKKAGLTGLNVTLGDQLKAVQDVFSCIGQLGKLLPGGAGASLDVALSDGKLTVRDTFTLGDLPLGLGKLSDVSLDLGLSLDLASEKVNFLVGIGDPEHPFNWIVSPLAGNGMIDLGVKDSEVAIKIEGGIGLGLAIDLGIASGSASVVISGRMEIQGATVALLGILTGKASVDVLGGLASASITLSAAFGFKAQVDLSPLPLAIGPEDVWLLATCSVGIHISICWVISIDFDGSWAFSQKVHLPRVGLA